MTPQPFGQTGLAVTAIAFGAMHFDGCNDEAEVGRLLNGVLDLGVNHMDTARGYGRGEVSEPLQAAIAGAHAQAGSAHWPGTV